MVSVRSPAIAFVAVLAAAILLSAPASAYFGRVGGRTAVENVKQNAEVQALGRFSVEEYKKQQQRSSGGGDGASLARRIEFREVVEAERQVVAGIKYYLKVAATVRGEEEEKKKKKVLVFDSVVVVVPWEKKKQLLRFAPSTRA